MDQANAALTLSVIGLVPTIYGAALPPLAIVRAGEGGHLVDAERMATLTAAAVVCVAASVTKSPEVLAVGTIMVIAYAAAYRTAARSGAQYAE
ncbi:hypothetical protein ACIQUZ_35535 [Streptomyces griseus]|uniref:hypothetical protein n=1 Tax=Streptomyces griseus TaxID=1911 RepID=UPI00382B0B90